MFRDHAADFGNPEPSRALSFHDEDTRTEE